MRALLSWIDDRTGLQSALRQCAGSTIPNGARYRNIWPSAILFAFVVQALSGLFLWMFYSPSAQTAWESVYYLQHEVAGGWLLRGVHHYSAQVMVAMIGLYLIQMILLGGYRPPREFLFWVVMLMGLVNLALLLTGDLLAWDQNSYTSTLVRTKFLLLVPAVGDELFKLAAGGPGPGFGHLTLTRFFALHAGLFSAAFLLLLILHARLERRAACAEAAQATRTGWYWPNQAVRNAAACLLVLLLVGLLVGQGAFGGDHANLQPGEYLGATLGAPADPAPENAYAAARPEWCFRGLYELSNMFGGEDKILPIFVIPSILMLAFLSMPIVGRCALGHALNVLLLAVVLVGTGWLTGKSLWEDHNNQRHQDDLAAGRQQADRAKQLARLEGIPIGGGLAMLRNDPLTQGPILFQRHCASCHSYTGGQGREITAEEPSAPDLGGFASRRWIGGLLDPARIGGPDYFGNTAFKGGDMVGFIKESLAELDDEEKQDVKSLVIALSAEAQLPSQRAEDARDGEQIEDGQEFLVEDYGCTECHRFGDEGKLGGAPDLSGYGSPQWLVGIICNPADKRFYRDTNDRMPAYAEDAEDPARNRLSAREIDLLADWIRGQWSRPED